MPLDDLVSEDELRTSSSTRKRALPTMGVSSVYKSWQRSTSPPPSYNEQLYKFRWPLPNQLQGTQVTASEFHPFWRRRLGARQDVGGNFSSVSQYVATQNVPVYRFADEKKLSSQATIGYTYAGPVLPDVLSNVPFPPAASSTDSVLDALGAGAVASVKPTNSVADLSTALVELYHEGLPRVIGSSFWENMTRNALRKGSHEYLNLEFGWKPLIDDVLDFAQGASRAAELYKQFERDSGKVVRRRAQLASVDLDVSTVFKANVPTPYTTASDDLMYETSSSTGTVYRRRETSVRRWFSGAFTYHLSSGVNPASLNRMLGCAEEAEHLYGVELSPETLWDLSPWSWAVDWVSSAGDVISTLSDYSRYGLVMPYGYVMEHSIVRDTYYWNGPTRLKAGKGIVPSPITLVTETKLRRKANPYGFGLTWQALSARQQSILAALGITRRGHS
jgi:hypothetical protein